MCNQIEVRCAVLQTIEEHAIWLWR